MPGAGALVMPAPPAMRVSPGLQAAWASPSAPLATPWMAEVRTTTWGARAAAWRSSRVTELLAMARLPTAPGAILELVTARVLSLETETAPVWRSRRCTPKSRSCAVPTDWFLSLALVMLLLTIWLPLICVAAYVVPPRATKRARVATASAGLGRQRPRDGSDISPLLRRMRSGAMALP